MVEESVSLDNSKLGKVPPFSWQAMSLKWKIGSAFSGMILLLGVLVVSIVYVLTSSALHKQVNFRASAIATNLSDAAAGHVSRRTLSSSTPWSPNTAGSKESRMLSSRMVKAMSSRRALSRFPQN